MKPLLWPCPASAGEPSREYALQFSASGCATLLIVPALFDEGNRMRRLTVEVQRRLADQHGVASVLPDLPGCNESLADLALQTPTSWQRAMIACAKQLGATHVLGVRGGSLVTPSGYPTLHYAPVTGASILRQMLRAHILAAREAGREERREDVLDRARREGITLCGHSLGADFITAFEALEPAAEATILAQGTLGGSGLWLRAEPSDDPDQADALALAIAGWIEGEAA